MASTIGTAYIQIEPSADGIGGKIDKALNGEMNSAGTSAGGKFASAFGTAAKVGATALVGATAAVGAFAKTSIDAGSVFDSAMSQVGATMGFTAEEINTAGSEANQTMEKLRNFAQEMGSTTAFSASEAAEALNYMALAGYDADTAMEMLPTVLNLAAAGGIDLAAASDMVTDASSALGLTLDETSQMTDKMAAAASKSNTSVEQLGEAYLTVGGTAKSLSGGTTELSTALGLLADNGIKGSEAGTHLRNIMLAMNPTTDKAIQAWDKLGISAYDAEGNLRPLEDTFADLNVAMADMTDQEKTDILSKMFNKTDLSSVNALLSTSAERWDELSTAIDDSTGAAENMAAVQLDNLSGDITLFQSALEGAKIAVSDQLTPTLREFVQFGSEGLSSLTEAFKSGGLSGAMDELGNIFARLLQKITLMLPSFLEAGMSLIETIGEGISANIPLLIPIILRIGQMLSDFIISNIEPLMQAGLEIILKLAYGITNALPAIIPQMTEVITNMVIYLLENADLMIDCAIKLIEALGIGILNAIPILVEKAPTLIKALINAIMLFNDRMLDLGIKLMTKLGDGVNKMKEAVANKGRDLVNRLKDAILNKVGEFVSIGKDIVAGIKQGIEGAWDSLVGGFMDSKVGQMVSSIESKLKIGSPSRVMADEIGRWIPAGIAVGIDEHMTDIDDEMGVVNSRIVNDAAMNSANASMNYSTTSDPVYSLLAQYLPMIAQGDNVTVTLEGDAKALFKSVKTQNDIYMRTTGNTAFA